MAGKEFNDLLHCNENCIIFALQKIIIMQQANISIRVDKGVKEKFCDLCEAFGLTTTAAFTLFMKSVIREKRIPFEIAIDENREWKEKAVENFESMRQTVANAGMQDLNLEEINEIIKEVRNEGRK